MNTLGDEKGWEMKATREETCTLKLGIFFIFKGGGGYKDAQQSRSNYFCHLIFIGV